WNMLIGGKLPIAAVPRPIQSLAIRASSARCRVSNVSNGSLKPANIVSLRSGERHRTFMQFRSEPPLHETAFKVSEWRVQEPAISPHICFARPSQMILLPCCCLSVGDAARRHRSSAFKPAETRQPHGQSPAWRRIWLIVQLLQRCQDVVETQPVRNTGDFAKG